ncbi:amino acid ABC transporter substrate-binding protein [Magnetospirillum sulfuroxidans]|nr:amino acid ABC transporter substrate-binding protein [Magnetospirillum sulfuroxidans]
MIVSAAVFFAVVATFLFSSSDSARADVLSEIRERGDLRCGVYPDDPGRSAINRQGRWEGFYVDFCRAVAAAVLGDGDAVRFVEVGPQSRFSALVEHKADVVMYSSTWTLGREAAYGIAFPAVYLFDGQGLMVRTNAGIHALADLNGRRVCVTAGTTTLANLENILRREDIKAKVVLANGDAFFRGNCDAYSADRINLATNRANRADDPERYEILPLMLSREPIGPMVRDDDGQWIRIVRSVVHAVIVAEELGLSRNSIDQADAAIGAVEQENLLGHNPEISRSLGLDRDWAVRVVREVGNYGEIFDRNFGPQTPIGLERGINRLWSQGGLLYSPLFK